MNFLYAKTWRMSEDAKAASGLKQQLTKLLLVNPHFHVSIKNRRVPLSRGADNARYC